MEEAVRVVEYSVASPEQRRSLADSVGDEIGRGATVVGMIPIALRQDEEGDYTTARVAVLYLGGEESRSGGEAVAAASVATEETASPSLVEDIMQLHEPEDRN
jgi:hypothetical protein